MKNACDKIYRHALQVTFPSLAAISRHSFPRNADTRATLFNIAAVYNQTQVKCNNSCTEQTGTFYVRYVQRVSAIVQKQRMPSETIRRRVSRHNNVCCIVFLNADC